ncbi:MAG: arginase family protein [Thaumarchaeota archaeon]|nr:arginase family protein [Nitrososphaerota archaeon]
MDATSILGIPLYTFSKHSGMGASPGALRSAGLLTAVRGAVLDEGDLAIAPLKVDLEEGHVKNFGYFKDATARICEAFSRLRTERVILIGDECSGTVGSVAGLKDVFAGKPGMLWMDAHGDFNTPESSPSGYIGGMCLAMACGRGPKLGDEVETARPLLAQERLVHVGSRALDEPEVLAFNSSPAKLFTAQQVRTTGARDVAEEAARHLANRSDWIICHLDVDVIDPSIVPAVSYPTPNGLTPDEVVAIISALDKTEKLKVIEIAAYNASLDRDRSSAHAVVDLMKRADLWNQAA